MLFLIIAMSAWTVRAAAAQHSETRDEVFRALGVDEVKADYVVLLDTSESMRQGDLYDRVVAQLRTLLGKLPTSDHLSLITFDSQAQLEYSDEIGTPPDQALNELPSPDGQGTDIGKAISAALDELEQPDPAPVGFVLLLTDGAHNPAEGSPFSEDLSGPGWDGLTSRAAALRSPVIPLALPLTEGADAGLLERVFPNTVIVSIPIDQLGRYLERKKEEARTAMARDLLMDDATSAVEITWDEALADFDRSAGTAAITVTFSSNAQRVPLTISGVSVGAEGSPVEVTGLPEEFELAPGESRAFQATLRWEPAERAPILKRTTATDGLLRVTGQLDSPWGAVMRNDLGLPFEPTLDASTFSISEVVQDGWLPAPLAVSVGLACALLLIAWSVWAYQHPRLSGKLQIPGVPRYIELNRRRVRIGEDARGSILRQIPGHGDIRGIRTPRGFRGESPLDITYSAPGPGRSGMLTGHSRCEPGKAVMVNGVYFRHISQKAAMREMSPSPAGQE